MSLNDFSEMMFYTGYNGSTIFVFDDEETLDCFACGKKNADVSFTLHSDMRPSSYIKEKYWKAPVYRFYAIGKNKIAVVIDLECQKRPGNSCDN